MKLYINELEAISAQNTFDTDEFLDNIVLPESNYYLCQKPEYKNYIEAKLMRRMSGTIKNGVSAAMSCLSKANIKNPDAIIIGTGLGCLSDTIKFLKQINDNQETMLNPTAFIQSTHNTVSGQIALILKCKNHNLTFSQKQLSFETAMTEAAMLAEENPNAQILLGGIDELTPESYEIICNTENYIQSPKAIGEGATFFVVSGQKKGNAIVKISDFEIGNQPLNCNRLKNLLDEFLTKNQLATNDIDVIISGNTGTENNLYTDIYNHFSKSSITEYKHIIGEYDTASAFGLWLGTKILCKKKIPQSIEQKKGENLSLNNALIINMQPSKFHSFILLEKC